MTVRGEADVFQLITSEALGAAREGVAEDDQREARQSVQVNLIGGEASGGVVVGKFDVREVLIPVVLSLARDHGEHLGDCVVNPFHSSLIVRVVGAGGDFAHA